MRMWRKRKVVVVDFDYLLYLGAIGGVIWLGFRSLLF